MRVIVDTNVLVSACIGKGPSSKVIEACLTGAVAPVVGTTLFLEYCDVFSRPAPFARARFSADERALLLRAFISACTWQTIYFQWRPNLADEADNHLIELAFAANAGIVVTSNFKDFQHSDLMFPQIEILQPEAFLDRYLR
ncbi:putative toxin-antitoxin system toxin component, PIN family [Mycoplana sp. MJR14]|uniref:putative toxin-antitoxin system toxin component, PIN family n=1 Tax=Mycoplana sp. MJR14 TaxID=3032583 RepID=UPI0023D9BCD2|nr:putative toxin-antitoxin system toxin component, PIN family [Mycoplana sp. MJR14]MDF1635733.1 putative toxin-antitoxin system toxin component, PIN family [Mycoplana sp. MJR14]